eukprot:146334-Chlamydomonas_euryale.AAC.5
MAALPLADDIPIAFNSCRKGPRGVSWRDDKPAELSWIEAQVWHARVCMHACGARCGMHVCGMHRYGMHVCACMHAPPGTCCSLMEEPGRTQWKIMAASLTEGIGCESSERARCEPD